MLVNRMRGVGDKTWKSANSYIFGSFKCWKVLHCISVNPYITQVCVSSIKICGNAGQTLRVQYNSLFTSPDCFSLWDAEIGNQGLPFLWICSHISCASLSPAETSATGKATGCWVGQTEGTGSSCSHADGGAGTEFPYAAEEEPGWLQPWIGWCPEIQVSNPGVKHYTEVWHAFCWIWGSLGSNRVRNW